LKAIREAKENTSWINQNVEYEAAVTSFVKAVLNPEEDNRFLEDFVQFQRRIARIGLWNGLSQTLLRLTCPGVPDIYQGNELWDFSLVDPDNRRPVNYKRRGQVFNGLRRWGDAPGLSSIECLLKTPEDGRIKAYLIWKTLCLRQEQQEVFQQGEYLPLKVAGAKADHVLAFVRNSGETGVFVIVPRLICGLLNNADIPPIGAHVWEDTHVLLPTGGSGKRSQNVFTGQAANLGTAINVSEVLAGFPVGLCLLS